MRLLRPCLSCGYGTTERTGRHATAACDPSHSPTSARNHRGVPPEQRGHGAEYRARRAELIGLPCHYCGKPADTADYAVPYSRGGTLDTLVPSCRHCNYARGNRSA